MAKKPYDFLLTDCEPIEFVDRAKLRVMDEQLTVCRSGERYVIPPASTLLIILGAGTSITGEAAMFAARHDCFIAFARAEVYLHSIWHDGRWQDPAKFIYQAKLHVDEKLRVAKWISGLRLKRESAPEDVLENFEQANTVSQLLGYEAAWAKRLYKNESISSNVKFRRAFDGDDDVNIRLNMLNNALYGFVTSLIISYGLHPSVAFVHGASRRGGLAFDIADVFKYELTIKPAFSSENVSTRELIARMSMRLKESNQRIIKEMLMICAVISGQEQKPWT
jgi:CRISPR-associated endonuclease Cas1